MEAIRKLQLEVDLNTIRSAIFSAPKLKILSSDVKVLRKSNKIRVYARSETQDGEYARLMQLARTLPNVVVKGINACSRAIISEEIKGHKKLIVEGNGLREVMTTDGKAFSSHKIDSLY
jgi:DNA-directed RNA polymerase III subunit RPC1